MSSALLALAVVLAACGGDAGEDAAPAEDAEETATGGGAVTTSGSTSPAADAVAADESLSPVVVGFHNLEGGAISLPEIRLGFESGVNYVNEELGGINGRPVRIESCNLDVTPESSVNCANQFVEQDVVAAVQGVDVAADAALPILSQAGIAEIAFFAFTPGVNKAVGDAFVTLFSQEEGYAADLITQQSLGAKHEAVVQADLPTAHAVLSEVIEPTAEELGIEISPFFYPTQADWTSFAATILAANPDAISFPAAEDQVCLGAIPALRAQGFTGVIHASSCAQIIDELDYDVLENVITHNEFYYETFTEIPDKPAQDIAIFQRFIERDAPEAESLVYLQLGFHVAVQTADMLRQVEGEVTAQSVKETLPTTKGEKFFSEDGYDCSQPTWPGTTACGRGLLFTRITQDKQKELIGEGAVNVDAVRPPS